MWQQFLHNFANSPKSTVIGLCGLAIAIITSLLVLPPGASALVIALAVVRAVFSFYSRDADSPPNYQPLPPSGTGYTPSSMNTGNLPQSSGTGGSKPLAILFLALLLCGHGALAQGVANLYMAGGAYNPRAVPAFAGSALYAHQLTDGTYAFTLIDALPNTGKPFTVTSNVAIGVAQKVATIAKVPILVPTAAGPTWTGQNVGWNWTTGVGVPIRWKTSDWYVMPVARMLKSSVSGGTGYQVIGGVYIGFGK